MLGIGLPVRCLRVSVGLAELWPVDGAVGIVPPG